MSGVQTKNASLSTALAFHYQVLIGLEHCFVMQENQSVWFERDGDVSLLGGDANDSKQVEVKNYADALTDHHENLWKTLKNWLAPEFHHESYGVLILHTTQVFGATTSLIDWNKQDVEQRLNTLQTIFKTRSEDELVTQKPKPIVLLQKIVMHTELEKLKKVLSKVVLFTESDDESSVQKAIIARLTGIPKSNQKSYLQGLVGFVYEQSNPEQWEISKNAFDAKCVELTATYCLKQFTLPPFVGYIASEEEVALHHTKTFIKKIHSIEYQDVIPEALGNWIELFNSLNEELDGAPQFRIATNQYRRQLISQFKRKHAMAKRKCINPILDSKNLFDTVISEPPSPIGGYLNTPVEYKNGLIHDALDDDDLDLHWKIDP